MSLSQKVLYLKTLQRCLRSPWLTQTYSFSDIVHKKTKLAPLQERRMIDRFRIWAKGGDGGSGCTSIRRSRHDRRGTPDGGNGGRGGDVILECSPAVWDLSSLQHHINAKRGGNGSSKNMIGSRGADKVIQVPVGTVIHLVEGELPSAVEKSSSSELDPWELPGTVDIDSSEFSTQSVSAYQTSSKVEKRAKSSGRRASGGEESTTAKRRNRALPINSRTKHSLSRGKFESDDDDLSNWEEESCGQMEDQDGDDAMGTECEDELEETEHIEYDVAELTEQGQRIVVARGGEGGLGNLSKGKASKMMQKGASSDDEISDDYDHASLSAGLPGSEAVLVLELKSIADIGLIGMPNAGKSTLLGALSKAKPTVGDYAFTTLRPNLGNLNYYDFSLTVADIPGLIRGAHENRGLGHAFLRHIERTKVLAYVVDLAAALGDNKGIPPWEQLNDLVLELEYYREGLTDRPSLVVANKIDEDGAEEVYKELKHRVSGVPIFPVSAVLEEGVPELKDGLRMLISGEQSNRLQLDGIVLHQDSAFVSI
ncbi:PREDICTED: probable GTP-binding protein OBGM, mitochondrial [Nicotiana attenuata]|uniref:Gtp-binding protein obgm, mitochondrial n=1 Tax=Nicotiana attenuata TaxID=49451 RepID=A0A1J6IWT6_NICAT|nr:PREDICTED: probable GTP-binding protein OBGM, mitochondrial [Nicotiana attenuata]XP_019243823.1 PREDICTED: probable GTP-binding protein OBGM, mitochondrial [Nicotiana attenuata]XP_019243824.1 PREDICTED: probable GTP-binding protein OBGM, mitochondrial [Nicotiana attenuata]XP_019243825.1 PREDICTED: probable GTP-binding protein OBGM, mitochondrial [Nicotiana attenuata]XP_019243826.1 PREDICTED: probable GTP-binding protein OBGM, mitochondrial [Nicotiana attenuata]OIT05048.1 putative gtp-bindin